MLVELLVLEEREACSEVHLTIHVLIQINGSIQSWQLLVNPWQPGFSVTTPCVIAVLMTKGCFYSWNCCHCLSVGQWAIQLFTDHGWLISVLCYSF